jgi:hypothetical protein
MLGDQNKENDATFWSQNGQPANTKSESKELPQMTV